MRSIWVCMLLMGCGGPGADAADPTGDGKSDLLNKKAGEVCTFGPECGHGLLCRQKLLGDDYRCYPPAELHEYCVKDPDCQSGFCGVGVCDVEPAAKTHFARCVTRLRDCNPDFVCDYASGGNLRCIGQTLNCTDDRQCLSNFCQTSGPINVGQGCLGPPATMEGQGTSCKFLGNITCDTDLVCRAVGRGTLEYGYFYACEPPSQFGGDCADNDHDCVGGLICVNQVCVNP
jgi:hypothetical protein